MILPNWLYDLLKWVAIICLPAFKVAIPSLFEIWNIPLGTEIANTLDIVAVLLGSLIGASCASYSATPKVVNDVEAIVHEVPIEVYDDTDKG